MLPFRWRFVCSSGGVASSVRSILCRSTRRHDEEPQQGHLASTAFKLGRRVQHEQLSWEPKKPQGQTQEPAEKCKREEAGGGGSHRLQRVAKHIRCWRREQKKKNKSGNVTSICSIHPRPDEGAGGAAASQQRRNVSSDRAVVTYSASEFGTYLCLLLHSARTSVLMQLRDLPSGFLNQSFV